MLDLAGTDKRKERTWEELPAYDPFWPNCRGASGYVCVRPWVRAEQEADRSHVQAAAMLQPRPPGNGHPQTEPTEETEG